MSAPSFEPAIDAEAEGTEPKLSVVVDSTSFLGTNELASRNDSNDEEEEEEEDDDETGKDTSARIGVAGLNKGARLTKEQQRLLELEFEKGGGYLGPKAAVELAHRLQLAKRDVTIWFANRRQDLGSQRKSKKWSPTPEQVSLLKQEYALNRYLTSKTRKKALAEKLKIDEKSLLRWFANCRKREKGRPSSGLAPDSIPDKSTAKDPSWTDDPAKEENNNNNNNVVDLPAELLQQLPQSSVASNDSNNALISSLMSCLDEKTKNYYANLAKHFCPELHSELSEIDDSLNVADDEVTDVFQNSLREVIEQQYQDSPARKRKRSLPGKKGRRVSFSDNVMNLEATNAAQQKKDENETGDEEKEEEEEGEATLAVQPKRKRVSSVKRRASLATELPIDRLDINSPVSTGRRASLANLSLDEAGPSGERFNDELTSSAKKRRAALTDEQIAKLREEFARSVRIDKKRSSELAEELNVPPSTIDNWFRKRRSEQNIKLTASPFALDVTRRLREEFAKSPHLDKARKKELADELKIKETSVYTWFYRNNKKTQADREESAEKAD